MKKFKKEEMETFIKNAAKKNQFNKKTLCQLVKIGCFSTGWAERSLEKGMRQRLMESEKE